MAWGVQKLVDTIFNAQFVLKTRLKRPPVISREYFRKTRTNSSEMALNPLMLLAFKSLPQ
jgi:hypothetical protein